jgi:hypothetical protein
MKIKQFLASVALAAVASTAFAAQAHMEAALKSLEQALVSLKEASGDKGGNRERAIKAVEQAIADVKKGIEFDRTHTSAAEAAKKASK